MALLKYAAVEFYISSKMAKTQNKQTHKNCYTTRRNNRRKFIKGSSN